MTKKCPYCKRALPRISSSITRSHNIKNVNLSKVKGTLVNFNILFEILEAERGVLEWQIEISKKNNDPYEVDELGVYLSVSAGSDVAALKRDLIEKFKARTEIMPNHIIILPQREMLERVEMEISHKARRLVDKRP